MCPVAAAAHDDDDDLACHIMGYFVAREMVSPPIIEPTNNKHIAIFVWGQAEKASTDVQPLLLYFGQTLMAFPVSPLPFIGICVVPFLSRRT